MGAEPVSAVSAQPPDQERRRGEGGAHEGQRKHGYEERDQGNRRQREQGDREREQRQHEDSDPDEGGARSLDDADRWLLFLHRDLLSPRDARHIERISRVYLYDPTRRRNVTDE
jgi:hypothetical protein